MWQKRSSAAAGLNELLLFSFYNWILWLAIYIKAEMFWSTTQCVCISRSLSPAVHCVLNLFLSPWSFQSLSGPYGPNMLAALVTVHGISGIAAGLEDLFKWRPMQTHFLLKSSDFTSCWNKWMNESWLTSLSRSSVANVCRTVVVLAGLTCLLHSIWL